MESQNIVITDVKMPFFSMVVFMIKWMLASIPAFIIIGIIIAALGIGIGMAVDMLGMQEMLDSFLP